MKRRLFLKIGTGAIVAGALSACGEGTADTTLREQLAASDGEATTAGIVVGWNRLALEAVRITRPGPPMVARSLALMHTSMYNAWSAYDPMARATEQGPGQRRPASEHTAANKATAMSHAAHAVLIDQFPARKAAFDAYLSSVGSIAGAAEPQAIIARDIGNHVASAMIAYCHTDGANQLGDLTPSGVPYADYTGYQSSNPPLVVAQPMPRDATPNLDRWQRLSYNDANGRLATPGFLAASWPQVKPFAMASASQFRPAAPYTSEAPEFLAQAMRVIEVQQGLTERHKLITEYWSDGPASETPPGHWALLAQFVSTRDRHGDDEDVKMFFALANAVFDAGIASWDSKRAYDSPRPISVIRNLMHGQTIVAYGPQGPAAGMGPIAGESWTPFQPTSFPTPPFPEYVSGHSTFSAAAAEVLKLFTGSDAFGASYTAPAQSMLLDPTLPAHDLTLEWPTFTDAVVEAGMSRVYGGIHFDSANLVGQELGRTVGALAFSKAQRLWQGMR